MGQVPALQGAPKGMGSVVAVGSQLGEGKGFFAYGELPVATGGGFQTGHGATFAAVDGLVVAQQGNHDGAARKRLFQAFEDQVGFVVGQALTKHGAALLIRALGLIEDYAALLGGVEMAAAVAQVVVRSDDRESGVARTCRACSLA